MEGHRGVYMSGNDGAMIAELERGAVFGGLISPPRTRVSMGKGQHYDHVSTLNNHAVNKPCNLHPRSLNATLYNGDGVQRNARFSAAFLSRGRLYSLSPSHHPSLTSTLSRRPLICNVLTTTCPHLVASISYFSTSVLALRLMKSMESRIPSS